MEKELLGYVYSKDGMHSQPILLDSNPENMAVFIARGLYSPKMVVTTFMDLLVLDTIGNYIDTCSDKKYLNEVLQYLIPMQNGKVNPFTKKLKWRSLSCDCYTREERDEILLKQLNNYFKYKLD